MKDFVGVSAKELWRLLVAMHQEIAEISVFSYTFPLPVQERAPMSDEEMALFRRARLKAASTGIPFHDAVVALAFSEEVLSSRIVNALTASNPESVQCTWVGRREILQGDLEMAVSATQSPCALAVASTVRLDNGSLAHFPMLDLRCPISDSSQQGLLWIGRHLFPSGGILLRSGRSYHLLGAKFMSHEQVLYMYGQALMFSPVVDRSYVAHHLVRGFGSLRISENKDSSTEPIVVEIFDATN